MADSFISFTPSDTYEQAAARAADLFGIERSYWDIFGKYHEASMEGITAVLESMGVGTGSKDDIDRSVEARLWEDWSRALPPTLVVSIHDGDVSIRTPRNATGDLQIELQREDGGTDRATVRLEHGTESSAAHLRNTDFVERRIAWPFERTLGYHHLRVTVPQAGITAKSRLIVCPDRAYFPPRLAKNGRAGGIFFSLYGVRSQRNWGCGDFTDLSRLAEWVAHDLDASFIGLNPLHAIPNRQPYNTSPYLPVCTFYKNLIYLDLEAIDDFRYSECARGIVAGERVQSQIRRLRNSEYVEYEQVQRLKLRVLKVLFRQFLREYRAGTARAQEFRAYVEREGELLQDFAVYSALDDVVHRGNPDVWLWRDWPPAYHDPRSEETRRFAEEHWLRVLFFQYIQWQLEIQLAAAQRRARELGLAVGLYHDLALATDRFGADLWAHRKFYVEGCRVGAPPDDFSPNGQDWSFPPPNAMEHYRNGYRLFSDSIRQNVKHGGALRIDHVMRFFHLFWIPDQLDARRGLYVKDRALDLIRILALESVRNEVIIVGEDLGTVADEIRETLATFGILSYRLFYFERWQDRTFKRPGDYPKNALVSASTHDLPTLTGFWQNRDIEARRAAGMFSDEAGYRSQIEDRMREKQKILDVLFQSGLMPATHQRDAAQIPELTSELHYAIVGFLASTPSALMLLSEEDLTKRDDQQNLPGTTEQYPNWRHKTRFTVEEFRENPLARDFSRMYRDWLARTDRLNGGAG